VRRRSGSRRRGERGRRLYAGAHGLRDGRACSRWRPTIRSLSEIQAIVRAKVDAQAPVRRGSAEAAEADPNFLLLLPAGDHGPARHARDRQDRAVLLDGVVNGVQGWLGMFVAYNFDVENMDFDHVNAESAAHDRHPVRRAQSGGALQLAAAKANFQNLKGKFDAAATTCRRDR